jgi:hypothetical protein
MATMCSLCGNIYEHYHNCAMRPPPTTLEQRVTDLERRLAMMADNVEALRRTTFHAARVAKKATR